MHVMAKLSIKNVHPVLLTIFAVLALAIAYHIAKTELSRYSTRVYVFSRIMTKGPGVNAAAVRSGKIIAFGREEELSKIGRVDRTFSDIVATPGFHDSSIRVVASSIALSADYIISTEKWPKEGGGFWPGANGPFEFSKALSNAGEDAKMKNAKEAVLVFGHSRAVHGDLDRAILDSIFGEVPCIAISRCFGTIVSNTSFLKSVGALSGKGLEILSGRDGADIPGGKFGGESALEFAKIAFSGRWGREKIDVGSERLAEHLSSVGITSVRDSTSSNSVKEWARKRFSDKPLEIRFSRDPMPTVSKFGLWKSGEILTAELSDALSDSSIGWDSTPSAHLKIDGSALSGMQQSKNSDGGVWTWPQEQTDSMCRAFLERGYAVRYETNGSFGFDMALSHLHRRTFEMQKPPAAEQTEILAVETADDAPEKTAAIEARVSIDISFAEKNSDVLRNFKREGVETGVHSGMPCGGMGPADPLATLRFVRENGMCDALEAFDLVSPPKHFEKFANFALLDERTFKLRGLLFKGEFHDARSSRHSYDIDTRISLDDPIGEKRGCDPGYLGDVIAEAALRY